MRVRIPPRARKPARLGDVAQLAERRVRNAKVVGSTPIVSTTTCPATCHGCSPLGPFLPGAGPSRGPLPARSPPLPKAPILPRRALSQGARFPEARSLTRPASLPIHATSHRPTLSRGPHSPRASQAPASGPPGRYRRRRRRDLILPAARSPSKRLVSSRSSPPFSSTCQGCSPARAESCSIVAGRFRASSSRPWRFNR